MAKSTPLFPINLTSLTAKSLMMKHHSDDVYREKRYLSDHAVFDFGGTLKEDGTCTLTMTFHDDDGFMMSGGCCLRREVTVSGELYAEFVRNAKLRRAVELVEQRKKDEYMRQLAAAHEELFGEPLVVED